MNLVKVKDRVINIDNVSTILKEEKNNKIIFNFTNAINIIGRLTPDYFSLKFDNVKKLNEFWGNIINNKLIKEKFLISSNPNSNEIVNKECVSNISFEQNKIIFNLNFSIDVTDKETSRQITISKFIYWRNKKYFEQDKKMIETLIKERI